MSSCLILGEAPGSKQTWAAVQPGINRICLKLRLKPDNLTDLASPNADPGGASNHASTSKASLHPPSPYASVAFDDSDMPPKEIYEPLLEIFFDSLAQHFPSIQRYRLSKRLENGTMSAFLLNGATADNIERMRLANLSPQRSAQSRRGSRVTTRLIMRM